MKNFSIENFILDLDLFFNDKNIFIEFEAQDGGKFFLIKLISQKEIAAKDLVKFMDFAKNLAEKKIPKRKYDFSWMIIFIYNGDIIDSSSGGWLIE